MSTPFDRSPRPALPPVDLVTADGAPTTLQAHIRDRPVLVQLVRYYGCLPCQHYLLDLHAQRSELAGRGVDLVVVGVAADFQAQHLRDTYALEVPLLLDPDQTLYRALELRRLRAVDLLRWSTWRTYLPLFVRRYLTRQVGGPTQGRPVGDALQLPGLALISPSGQPLLVQRGEFLGDYPPVPELLAAVDDVLASAGGVR